MDGKAPSRQNASKTLAYLTQSRLTAAARFSSMTHNSPPWMGGSISSTISPPALRVSLKAFRTTGRWFPPTGQAELPEGQEYGNDECRDGDRQGGDVQHDGRVHRATLECVAPRPQAPVASCLICLWDTLDIVTPAGGHAAGDLGGAGHAQFGDGAASLNTSADLCEPGPGHPRLWHVRHPAGAATAASRRAARHGQRHDPAAGTGPNFAETVSWWSGLPALYAPFACCVASSGDGHVRAPHTRSCREQINELE